MKIALTADLHLDLRQFNRQERWKDYIDTFSNVIRKVLELDVDAFIIAGDLFEKYRPHPGVVRRFLKEVSKLNCPIILIRGNHDSPKIFFEKFGGDTLHLLQDVAKIIYLNKENPTYELDDVCFIGLGYVGFNVKKEISQHLKNIETKARVKVGIFHQLLDYPGVPENQIDVSKSFLRGLGLDYILMGHWHLKYSEDRLFNPGSPEYWSFDQGELIELNLDTGEETIKPSKEKGFYLIDTTKGAGEFIKIKPARSMYNIIYKTEEFNEAIHIQTIQKHLETFNLEGVMIKTLLHGRCKYGRINIRKEILLDKPLFHTIITQLKPSDVSIEKIDSMEAQTEYLMERGISDETSRKLAKWLATNHNRLSIMPSNELLNTLRSIIKSKKK
ncbi:DNA repair exonuclease [Candidatus Bathyarchaeota archaeon]|nr:DNA repair exonuclease [Candidatus Bathyarchaeota archaeon]